MNVGFIGVGQAGGNIADIADTFGYTACIMNTSPEDLSSITNIMNTSKLLIGSNGGCGKNRALAKADVKSSYKNIINFVREKFDDDIDLVYVVFSAGGGTGSGMSPMIVDLLIKSFPNKRFGAVMVLPSLQESVVSFVNSLGCIKEVFSLNIPTIIADNNKFAGKFTKKRMYDMINHRIIENFNLLFRTERESSKLGNLDNKDLSKLLSTPGMTIINDYNIAKGEDLDEHSFAKGIMDSWNNNIYCEIDHDKIIKRMGFIYEISDAHTQLVNNKEITKEVGEPLEIFDGYYKPANNSERVISIITGLSFPESHLKEIEESINVKKGNINTKKESSMLEGIDTDWFNGLSDEAPKSLKSDTSVKSTEDIDFADLFSKY